MAHDDRNCYQVFSCQQKHGLIGAELHILKFPVRLNVFKGGEKKIFLSDTWSRQNENIFTIKRLLCAWGTARANGW